MKFEKLIQIMEARGVDMSPVPELEPIKEEEPYFLKDDIALLKGHKFFKDQFDIIKKRFLEYKKAVGDFGRSYKGGDFFSDMRRIKKQRETFNQAIDKLTAERKDKLKIVNSYNLSNSDKEELERELRKLETELKVVKDQLKTRPHSDQILKLVTKFERLTNKYQRSPLSLTDKVRDELVAEINDIRNKLDTTKFIKSHTLISKVLKDYPRFIRMTDRFNNTKASPTFVNKAKSTIFDLDKDLKTKQREYDNLGEKLQKLIDDENGLNSTVEGYNDRAMEQFKILLKFTADMLSRDDNGDLDPEQLSRIQNLVSTDEDINPILNKISEFNTEYGTSPDTGYIKFNSLPFNQLINLIEKRSKAMSTRYPRSYTKKTVGEPTPSFSNVELTDKAKEMIKSSEKPPLNLKPAKSAGKIKKSAGVAPSSRTKYLDRTYKMNID